MNAEIIAVGSEMLTPEKVDTNSLYLTQQLNTLGVEVVQKAIIGDDRDRLAQAITASIARSEILILSGGLGPTEDDVTRDAVAVALGRSQSFNEQVWESIVGRFRRLGRHIPENNKRQANVIEGAEILENPRGSAPGQWISHNGAVVALLPGPPKELKPLFDSECIPRLRELLPPLVIRTLHMRIAGMGESDVDQRIAPVYTRYANPVTTILAGAGDISLHLRARSATGEEAERLLDEVRRQIDEILGDRIYTHEGRALEDVILGILRDRSATVSTAESCTGGMIAQRLTSVPGSSDAFRGGMVAYSEDLKIRELAVEASTIEQHSAVSEQVASEMALGACRKFATTYAVGTTGYAGPTGGTDRDPVGTVYIGIAGPDGVNTIKRTFPGDRERVRLLASQWALDALRRAILGLPSRTT